MKHHVTSLSLIVVALAAFGFVASACGGGGGGNALTIAEYFERIQDIDDASTARSDTIEAQLDDDIASTDDESKILELFNKSFSAEFANLEQLGNDLAGLNPPDEVANAHNESVAAIRNAVSAFRDIEDEFTAAGSIDDVTALFLSDEFDAAQQRTIDGCLALETLSVELEHPIDLDCDE